MGARRERIDYAAEADIRRELQQLEAQAVTFGYRFIKDAVVREEYLTRTRAFSEELLASYRAGDLSAKQTAEAANQMRNELMEFARTRSSDIGRAKAVSLKAAGLDMDALVEKYALQKYRTSFRALGEAEKNEVYLEVARAAGRANPRVSASAARLGAVGRGLWVLAALIAIYNVGTAEYKVHAAGREAANAGGGFGGGAAGGAVAGIWFGPVGVAVGVVVGGVLGSLLADQAYVELSGPRESAVRRFLPRFTGMFHVDEAGIARAMIVELGINLEAVYAVFRELDRSYSTDADDVAVLYLTAIRKEGRPELEAGLRAYGDLRNFLIEILKAGWTSDEEKSLISYLESLAQR